MIIKQIDRTSFRNKVIKSYESYIKISDECKMGIGIYYKGNCYIFGNGAHEGYKYDMGSISKTITAHFILYLEEQGLIDINNTIDKYITLKKGIYPTIYELLTHSANYGHLTPIEITIPNLLKHRYSNANPYQNCDCNTLIKAIEKRNEHKQNNIYGYSDFAYAILAVITAKVCHMKVGDAYEEFLKEVLAMNETKVSTYKDREPLAIKKGKILGFWKWKKDNPYIGAGGLVTSIKDMLKYMKVQIESEDSYIVRAHKRNDAIKTKQAISICLGWHTYKKSNQLWHVGGVGTFRSSIIINKEKKIGVFVLGNSKGKNSANVHYLTKMIYSELKLNKIKLDLL